MDNPAAQQSGESSITLQGGDGDTQPADGVHLQPEGGATEKAPPHVTSNGATETEDHSGTIAVEESVDTTANADEFAGGDCRKRKAPNDMEYDIFC